MCWVGENKNWSTKIKIAWYWYDGRVTILFIAKFSEKISKDSVHLLC